MSRRILTLVAVLALFGSASCSRSPSSAGRNDGLVVTTNGSATVAWEPLVVLTANGRGDTKTEAFAEVRLVLETLTGAAKRAVPGATITVNEAVQYSLSRSVATATQRLVVDAGSLAAAESVLKAVFATKAERSCCVWRVILRPLLGSSVMQAARKDALHGAGAEARELASAAGVKVGKILAIHEGASTYPRNQSLPERSFNPSGLQLMMEDLRAHPPTSEHDLVSLEVRFAIA